MDDEQQKQNPSVGTSSEALEQNRSTSEHESTQNLHVDTEQNMHAHATSVSHADNAIIDWSGPSDPENPFNWSYRKKWRVTLLACFMTFAVQINGTSMTSAAEQIDESFHVSDVHFPHSYWPVLSWNLGGAAAPLIALPLMENFGIRCSYISIYVCLIIFLIPQVVAQNFTTLIVTRIITGGCSGVLANITSSIVNDIWREGKSKSFSISLWIWGLLAGLSIGPVLGSATLLYTTWRWIFLSEIIFYTALIPLLLISLPEIRHSVLLTRRARLLRSTTSKPLYARAELANTLLRSTLAETVVRPSRMLATEPVVLSFGLWSAFCVGTAFMFTQSIVQVYGEIYSWSYFGTGIVQFAVVIGELLGLVASIFQDDVYFRSAQRNAQDSTDNTPIPEARLYLSVFGSFFGLTAGLFVYAWTSKSEYHWVLPTVGLALVGFGMFTVVSAVSSYILDCYGNYAASAVAGVAFLENAFAAFLPLATQSMYRSLGFGWASSLLGFLALGLSGIPVVLIIWGDRVREKSRFMNERECGYGGGHAKRKADQGDV
ncbi:MFS multidrug transporter-like protein [Dendryphion nanum]|uniref:MFS multidrug transporter-like protein n=1 Tax=Dendryphion nanum TaxID=256645 RepID=A0A9P9IRH3_9PLEO|nr:MFS multidrug transporter-like protein [Dendryphion nanum]